MYSLNSSGSPLQRSLKSVLILVSLIFRYLSFMSLALNPYQGREPRKKYRKTFPKDSKSSLLLCSIPRWVLILAYLAVPVKPLFSLYLIWTPYEDIYFFARPKSKINILWEWLPIPIAKLSGFMSLWMILLSWIYLTLLIIWSANIHTVLTLNFFPVFSKSDSKESPNRSMIITFLSLCVP